MFGGARCLSSLPGWCVMWSFFCRGKGLLVTFEPLVQTVLGFMQRCCGKEKFWLLYSFVDFSRACRFDATVY